MAVIVTNGATNLSATGAYYRAESYNLCPFNNTNLQLTTARQIPVTFANAGNCQGIILHIVSSNGTTKDVTVKLQEYVAGVWTDRVSKTLTYGTITNSTADGTYANWITPFIFNTPYAVDTTASKWRFDVSQSVSGSGYWLIRTSNGTAPAYITWCDNTVSYTLNDVLIAKDKVTIDQTCRFNGLLSTGDAANSICGIVCTTNNPDYNTNGMIVWENAPSASYTMTLSGVMVLGAHAGFHVGTEANPIPLAKKAVIEVAPAVVGTATISGIYGGGDSNNASSQGRANLQMYGEIPTVRSAILASDALASQPVIETTTATGWVVGDMIFPGKALVSSGLTETGPYLITGISGTTITMNNNVKNYLRRAGGDVIKLNGYGIEFVNSSTATPVQYLSGMNNLVFSGVRFMGIAISSLASLFWKDDLANIGTTSVNDCSVNKHLANNLTLISNFDFADKPAEFKRNHVYDTTFMNTIYGRASALKTISDNIFISSQFSGLNASRNWLFNNNRFYNNIGAFIGVSAGFYNSTVSNNYFWGTSYGPFRTDSTSANLVFKNNVYERVARGVWCLSTMVNCRFINEDFGPVEGGTFPIFTQHTTPTYVDVIFDTPKVNVGVTTTSNLKDSSDGSGVHFQNYNQVDKVDFTETPYGTIYRTGTGLSDTTVRTAGGYAMRFEPNFTPNSTHWEQNVPVGNIQNKTMTFSVWVKINNSAYWGGTHIKPTLTLNYDNGTIESTVATATTNWQRLAITITPATTFGRVNMQLSGSTSATGSNAYFYVDDVNIAYPAGVTMDLGSIDLWADGLPVAPTIATMPSLGGVWDELQANHNIAGSFGAVANETLSNTDVTQAKVDTL